MYIELHDTFVDHRKVRRMSKDVSLPPVHVRGHLVTLWLNVLRHATDGNLSDWTPDDIAAYADWDGDAQAFVDALVRCEWLVERSNHLEVNDWREYAEHLKSADRKATDRERKKAERESEKKLKEASASAGRPEMSENVQGRPRTSLEIHAERSGADQNGAERSGADLTPLSSSHGEPDRSVEPERVAQVFAHYRTHHERAHPKPKRESKEWRCIAARLREGYSVDDLRSAIDGCHLTPHNLGENERSTPYLGLELIMRTGSQVTRFRETAIRHANGPPPVLSEREQRGKRAGQQWAERKRQAEQPPPAVEVVDAAG